MYRFHIRHEDAHECWTDKNLKNAAALHGGTSGWRHFKKTTDHRQDIQKSGWNSKGNSPKQVHC